MNTDQLLSAAQSGDITAMTLLAEQYLQDEQNADALYWYEQAAFKGPDFSAAYCAMLVAYALSEEYLNSNQWDEVFDYASRCLVMSLKYHSTDNPDDHEDPENMYLAKSIYYMSAAAWMKDEFDKALECISMGDDNWIYHRILHGICAFDCEQYETAHSLLIALDDFETDELAGCIASRLDDLVFGMAFINLSIIMRDALNDIDASHDLLLKGMEVVQSEQMHQSLQEMLSHYQPGLAGGWRWTDQ